MLKKGRKKINLPIKEILKKWEQGDTQEELSKEYGVSKSTINRKISEYYEKEEKEKPKRKVKQKISLPIEEVVEKWKQGYTQEELSKEYGVSEKTISESISEYYEEKRDNEKKFKVLKSSSVIVEYLIKGLTIEQIKLIALKKHIIVPEKVIEKAKQKLEQLEAKKAKESIER